MTGLGNMETLFVCGCPRSGTTVLAEVLNAHPRICVGIERFKNLVVGQRGAEFTPALFEWARFSSIEPEDTNVVEINRKLILRKERAGRELAVIGDKTPRLYTRLPFLRTQFPEARLIYIVRDPLDVARSWQKRAENPADNWPVGNGLAAALVEWERSLDLVWRDAANWDKKLTIIEYQQFFGCDNAAALQVNLDTLYRRLGLSMLSANLEKTATRYWRQPTGPTELPSDPDLAAAVQRARANEAWQRLREMSLKAKPRRIAA